MPTTAAGGANTFAPQLNQKHNFDESNFVKLEKIPIFDAHKGSEEGLDIDFDDAMLQKIIDRCNNRIKDTGDRPPLVDGHESEDNPDPDILGFAQNFHMGELGNVKKRKAIFCDFLIHKDKFQRARQLPRRSIELWHKDLTIDPVVAERAPIDQISLLGATRPARDLGLVTFSKENSNAKYRYSYKESLMDPQNLKQILEAVMQLPVIKWLEEQKKMIDEKSAEAPAEAPAEEAPVQESAETVEEGKEPAGEEDKQAYEDQEDEVKSNNDVGEAKIKMQFEQQKRKYSKLESEYKTLYAKVAQIERRERVATRHRDLMQLEAEGYVFDMSDEVDTVADLEPKKYSKHLSLIKKNYKKAPIGGLPGYVKPVVPAGEENLSPREVMLKAQVKAAELYSAKEKR